MGKKKQSKLYQLNKEKSKEQKEQMKQIMKKLAENKKNNMQKNQNLVPITEINMKNKKIKKEKKQERYQAAKKQFIQQQLPILSQHTESVPLIATKKINIFQTTQYDSGIKTQIKVASSVVSKEDQSSFLQSQAKKLMGPNFNLDKFGEKPLRIIQQTQKVDLSDDEDQPNSMKHLSHPNLQLPQGNFSIKRSATIQEFRKKLPIYMKQQQIIQTINNNLVTLICGQTGSGKSTQLPQFLAQKNYHSKGKIGITQPRRLATISLAARVSQQMNCDLGTKVGYQVRHQKKDSQETFIKFMTDGILLNQMNSDFLLQSYSIIVIDEAHERKVNTDILIGLLSKVILIRYKLAQQGKCFPLRLAIMSATMRIDDFNNKKLFNFNVPILKVEARMFPVTIYYQKNTPQDYKKAAIKKCIRIHKSLPDGDVLIFMTGKQQIHQIKLMLEQQLQSDKVMDFEDQQQQLENHPQNNDQNKLDNQTHSTMKKFIIFELYSSLPLESQKNIFKNQTAGTRKFVISTNIAQTSITIPNIRYVIDCGQQKHRFFDNVWKWKKGWGSKAMAQQRSGRAGRTAHGYCYRLYSSALYANIMEDFPPPQILKQPLQSILLQIKTIGIQNVYNFPFPTQPEFQKIYATLQKLLQIEAITGNVNRQSDQTKITNLGTILSFIPLEPRLGKMLLKGRQKKVQKYILLAVILLTVQNIYEQQHVNKFLQKDIDDDQTKQNLKNKYMDQLRKKNNSFKDKFQKYMKESSNGDIFTAINIIGEYFVNVFKKMEGKNKKIQIEIINQSKKMHLNSNTMREIYFNADQICQIYETLCNQKIDISAFQFPSGDQVDTILDIFLSTFVANVCRHSQKSKYETRDSQLVYIHNLSPLYMKSHLFIGCVDYYATQYKRTYMKYPFLIKNYQLLAKFGRIKQQNTYTWKDDQIIGITNGQLYQWEIPNLYIYKPIDKQEKWISLCKMFLSGFIFPEIKALHKYLRSPLSTVKIQNFDYKLQKFVQTLKVMKLNSKSQFLYWFSNDQTFLKKQIESWVNMKNFQQAYKKLRASILKDSINQKKQ